MTDSKKAQAVGALRKCAKEHEKDFTPTFNIRVSDLCSDVADYLEELVRENVKLNKMLEMTFGDLCSECDCPYWTNINWENYRAELENRVENE